MAFFSLTVRIVVQIAFLIEAVASLSQTSIPATPLPQIPTIPASEFDPNVQYYHTIERRDGSFLAYETPVIVQGVLSEEACEKLTDDLVSECGRIEVTLQRKRRAENTPSQSKKSKREQRRKTKQKNTDKSNGKSDTPGREPIASTTDLYLCSFLEAIELVLGQSKHDDALLAFCEGLLDSPMNTEETSNAQSSQLSLQQKMETVREELFQQRLPQNSRSSSSDDTGEPVPSYRRDPCWFREYFPAEALPTDCVILAGEGATSTLHRDPLEWTGTNMCLDGTKVWRFVAPPLAVAAIVSAQDRVSIDEPDDDDENSSSVSVIDGLLDAYRLDSIAWGDSEDDPLTLSAGWQSDYSLFSNFHDPITSKDLLTLEETAGTKDKIDTITNVASDVDRLRPDIPVGVVGAAIDRNGTNPPEECIEVWSGVQKAGDMIVIPAHWWHQTYAMEASLAIASQRCGAERDSERVIRHILETTATLESVATESTTFHKGRDDPEKILSLLRSKASSPQETVDHLFDFLASLREERRKEAK